MLTLAYSLFWVNFIYGIAVKFNVFEHKKFKILHHLIYFFVMLSLFITTTFKIYNKKFSDLQKRALVGERAGGEPVRSAKLSNVGAG